ncbi:hypothetical protein AHMF7605_20580 [Adhaeribacter arboris]|uniref:Uncharacterized protein n=1 Tax=Adhaeribacter arboris TaxID=2072846 RepID=A0A2T2YJP0_9BACT|nr:tetratricopeptide repeat protein [Adhaeribacter arboris]PSR55728.1 hypothetical protein AHMF7605_20580 [Adhaeribacter arboris]
MNQLFIRYLDRILVVILVLLVPLFAAGQTRFLTQVPPAQRLPRLWQYCSEHSISDWDSTASHQFLNAVTTTADSLDDEKLKSYAQYFRICYRLLFSNRYQQYYPPGDYQRPMAIFLKAQAWALKNNNPDIAAACEHYIGQVYFQNAQYGLAFDHLLQSDAAFRRIGYPNVPAIAIYLSNLGLNYYRFEEYDKALAYFLAAARYPFYFPRIELSTLNSIGLIYARTTNWEKAISFYRRTIKKAQIYKDVAWLGIASGNLGNVFLTTGQNDSALFYHRKNYKINAAAPLAPEDAAKSALAVARVFIRQQQTDSAQFYLQASQPLARESITDPADRLEFNRRRLGVLKELCQKNGLYQKALLFSDSLAITEDSLQQLLDAKILSRSMNKAEAVRYGAELKLLQAQKNLSRWQFSVIIVALLLIIVVIGWLFNRYRMRQRRQAELAEKENKLLATEKKLAEEKWQHAENLLVAYISTLKDKAHLINDLTAELHHLRENSRQTDLSSMASRIEQLVSTTILTEEDWRHFRQLFDQTYPGFIFRLKEKMPDLSPAETRFLILTKLQLSSRDMAHMLGLSVGAIRKARYRLRKKFNLEEEVTLDTLIQQV